MRIKSENLRKKKYLTLERDNALTVKVWLENNSRNLVICFQIKGVVITKHDLDFQITMLKCS